MANVTLVRQAGGMTPPKTLAALIGHGRTKGIRQERLTRGVLFRRHLWTHPSKLLNFLFWAGAVAAPPSRQTLACQAMEITCNHRRHHFSPAKSLGRVTTWRFGATWRCSSCSKALTKRLYFLEQKCAMKSYTASFTNLTNTLALHTALLFVSLITEPHTQRHTVILTPFQLSLVSFSANLKLHHRIKVNMTSKCNQRWKWLQTPA